MSVILYHVTFVPEDSRLGHKIATVRAVEDKEAFCAYHWHSGKHIRPDYSAIRDALPHYHRKAYDRNATWWFPSTMHSRLSGILDLKNSCSRMLYDRKGKKLGTLYACPYLYT